MTSEKNFPAQARTRVRSQTLVLWDFPRPDVARLLSPNGRAHWAAKRKARLSVMDHVVVAGITSGLKVMWGGMVTLYPTFVYPDHRKRDDDNLATGVMKAVRDSLVQAQWLEADDLEHLRQMPVEVRVEKGHRSLELRFEID